MTQIELANQARLLHAKGPGKLYTGLSVPLETMQDLALAYSPGVGTISSDIASDPELSWTLTGRRHTVAVISDGSAVLGLGNIGPLAAMPVMEGKAALFKRFAGLDAMPLCLNTQNTDEIISIIQSLEPSFGAINIEDISAPRCFAIEEALQKSLSIPIMHDDQWGTAIVALAGLLNACRVVTKDLKHCTIVVVGAGAAGIAISRLLLHYGADSIILCDSNGIITPENASNSYKSEIVLNSKKHQKTGLLADALFNSDICIAVSAPNTITSEMIASMSDQSIVFALSNPIPEIMPELAYAAGAAIVATGRSDYPNQINNALVFPQLFRHCISLQIPFTRELYVQAAHNLAKCIPIPRHDYIIPNIFEDYTLFP
jgi:malate dehydrogenase (oxaloacetate-decarboxylating)